MTTLTVTELVDGVAVESPTVTIAVVEGVAGITQAEADALYAPLGSSGAVDSVNGNTGVVVLDADDIADGTTNKAYTATEKTKLAGVAPGATANSSDATLLARANHTGTQAIATVTGLQGALDGKETAGAAAAAQAASQPLDSDLTAISALSTTSFGRALLALADAAAGRTALGLGTAATAASTDFQPLDSDLTSIAALATTSFGRSLLEAANASALRTLAGLVLGTDIYSKSAVDAGFQPLDADLTAIAAVATTSYGRALLAVANLAALQAILGTGTPSSSTYLRGDGTWATPSASTPALSTYTPTVAGQTVAPTLGTGATQFGRYVDDGLYVSVDIYVKFGTTGFAAGTGYYAFLLPVTAHADDVTNLLAVGNGRYTKNSTGAATPLLPALVDSTHVIGYLSGTTILGAAQPAAMSQSDEFRLQIRYRKA